MSSNRCRGVLALVFACLWGCQSDNLLLATHTKVGLDIALDGNTPTSGVFGYKRFEGAIVPVDDPRTPSSEMESVFGALDVRNGWLNGMDIHQMLATGTAAEELAKDPEQARALLELLEGDDDSGGR